MRDAVFRSLKNMRSNKPQLANVAETRRGRLGEGLAEADMKNCIWLKPQLVAAIEYAEWTPANHLRMPSL
jgi:bifunctional non-homologous end joining protein LigD